MGQRARILAVIATVGAALGMVGPQPAGAADPATITVTTTSQELGGPGCSLPEAILAANHDASTVPDPIGTGGTIDTECSPGVGDDVIHLAPGATYLMGSVIDEDHNEMGPTATPVVRSSMMIEGQGAKIVHTGTTPFRAFAVGASGHLDLREVHVKDFFTRGGDGFYGGGGGLGAGGAIYVHNGSLLVQWSTFESNGALGGAGADRSGGIGGPGGGGGGGLGGDGGSGYGFGGGGGGGGGARGRGGSSGGFGDGGGGGGTVSPGGKGEFDPRPGGYRCGGAGASGDVVDDDDGNGGSCEGGGGGGGGSQTGFSGEGGTGNYGGGGGGGANDTGDGGHGGFGGGGGGASYWVTSSCDGCGGAGGDAGFGGGAGSGPGRITGGPGSAGTFGGGATGFYSGGGAGLGGAIFGHSGRVEVRNSTFTGNYVAGGSSGGGTAKRGSGAGGAIFTVAGQLVVTNSTIARNVSLEDGAGIVVYKPTDGDSASVSLRNTIVAGNTGIDECYLRNGPTITDSISNLVTPHAGDSLPGCPEITVTSPPGLGALAINAPGTTPTMAIGVTSPALDAGDADVATADDQRGVLRPQGGGVDIGAYEFEAASDPGDVIPPTATPGQSPAANGAGWNNTDVIVTWGWADDAGGTGLDPNACPATSTSSGEGSALLLSTTCADLAGNGAAADYTVKVDKTAPGVVCGATPTYVIGSTPSTGVTATVTDDLSLPLVSPIGAVVTAADVAAAGGGTKPLTGSDGAGNTTTVSCPYTVSYLFLGFAKPPTGSSVRRGSAVPVTFRLGDASGSPISDAAAAALLSPTCRVQVTLDGAVVGCAKYSALTDSFQYEVNTPKSLPVGPHTVGIRVTAGGQVVNSNSMTITVR